MSWFEKIVPSRIKTERRVRSVPEGLWIKCPACDAVLYRAELERNLHVCPKCSHHMRMHARERLQRFLDPDSGVEIGAHISPEDPLKFKDSKKYKDRLAAAQKSTNERDALVAMAGRLHGEPVRLKQREYDLALLLFRNIGRLLPREYLMLTVWGQELETGSRSLDTHVSRLRTRLNLRPANGMILASVYGLGYRLEYIAGDEAESPYPTAGAAE